ncbi:MAG TPA: cadherin-like beta sandwich domain-containing protein [Deltaproteobacteria bacterium]|nr:cadherin-like beta sandwich domain-containing protein [Deltaproteobacteria bacterium]
MPDIIFFTRSFYDYQTSRKHLSVVPPPFHPCPHGKLRGRQQRRWFQWRVAFEQCRSGITDQSSGTLNPSFDASTLSYTTMIVGESSITLTPTAEDSGATIQVNGEDVVSGQASSPVTLDLGENTITIVVTAEGFTTKTYTVIAGYVPQEAFLKASNAEADDRFGVSVAPSGDTLAVGACFEDSSAVGGENDNSASNSGAVYILRW